MSTIRKTLKDKDGNYICPAIPSRSIEGGDIKLGAVKAENIDFTTFEYSTTEQVVGKWIDGKLIYKKTFEFLDVSSGGFSIDITNLDVDTMVKIEATGYWDNNKNGSIAWPYYISNIDNGRVFKNGNTVYVQYSFPDYNHRGIQFTLYYTKTS